MDAGGSAAAIDVLVQNLINVCKEEYSLIRGLRKDAKQLQTTLCLIQGYLNDAKNKSITQDAVKIWLRELEDVAFDADNALDDLTYHDLHKKVKKMKTPKAKDKVLSCFSSLNHIARPRNMALRIKQINTSFEIMNKMATELGLHSIIANAPAAAPHASFETNSFTHDPIFYGRDDDLPKLVGKLTQIPEEQIFSILAIWGMGGIGKTTLTRKVFNHPDIKTRFEPHIWVHVSQIFDPIVLFKKILSTLTPLTSDAVESAESILKKLQQALKDKIYLLVLDDVWNDDVLKWEYFKDSMLGVTSTKGNAIIITTRKDDVASTVRPFHIHALDVLSNEDCWSIIKAKAFENGDAPSGYEMIGKEIAKRCGGLPLAANVVGGVLCCKPEKEWRSINENWLTEEEGGENILNILKLSFDNLASPSLKKCFAYCSIFPKGFAIEKQQLIELWMAEGFLQADERNDMESVGSKFLNVLVHNSLLIQREDAYGHLKNCVMHDLVHDIASSVAGCSDNAGGSSTPVRYMILNEESSAITKEVAKHLRTLFVEGEISGNIFSDLECLRVLNLSRYRVEELPNSIKKLIHLRNLNISWTRIENLPEWIGELHHLQTLRAYSLRKLPSTLKYLINLRHLYIDDDVELPAEIGRLTSLQTLEHFRVGECQIEELGGLKDLKGKLKIHSLEKVRNKVDAEKAKMLLKSNLLDLEYVWYEGREGERNDESVLEGLQPHANLNKLCIKGFKGKRFPLWTRQLNNLIEITLSECHECEEIPTLEHSSFNNLMSLILDKLEGLECLPDSLFYNNQNLSKLEIFNCPNLCKLPDGLDTLTSLEKLTIFGCSKLKSMGNPSGGGGQSQAKLHWLFIFRCEELMELPSQWLELWAPSLVFLSLQRLSSLKNLPMVIDCLAKSATLRELNILGVPRLMSTGSVESWPFGGLRELRIDVSVEWSMESSVGIKETVDGILQGCCNSPTRLRLLRLIGMANWKCLPEPIQHLTTLDWLELENMGLEELPQWLGNLSSLQWLYIRNCTRLRCLNALDHLTQLHSLRIANCEELSIDSEWRKTVPHLRIEVDGRSLD